MSDRSNKQSEELHPLLPSGEWEGFYCYHHSSKQHKMEVELNFSNSNIAGSGNDDIAAFTWKGKYDLEKFKASMTKMYTTHHVWYKGDIDENGIWGLWELDLDYLNLPQNLASMIKESFKNEMTGGFHIWPRKNRRNAVANQEKAQNESEILREIFTETFA